MEPSRLKLLHPKTLSEGFTQSELSLLSLCPQKWNWQYNQLLFKPGIVAWPLLVGTVFHDAMEQLFSTKGKRVKVATLQFTETQVPAIDDFQKLEYFNTLVPIMVEAYRIYHQEDFLLDNIESLEEVVEVEYRGFRLRGKIDKTTIEDGQRVLTDYKTTSRIDKASVAGWDFRFQFMFYLWLKSKLIKEGPPLGAFRVDAVKKTELRVKKTENLEGFGQRVFQDMIADPDKYFYRERFPIIDGSLEHFQTNVLDHKLNRIKAIVNPDTPLDVARLLIEDKNTEECQRWGIQCPFLDLSRHGYDKMGQFYRTKSVKHEELEDNE